MRRILKIILVLVVIVAGWLAWAIFVPATPPKETFVLLRPGYSTRRIARELKNAGVVHSSYAFVIWHYFHRARSLKAGEYVFDHPAGLASVHSRLARGDVYVHTVVIPEGFTMFDIAQLMELAGLGPSSEFLRLARSETSLIADLDPSAHSLEGYLFPDTYEITRTQTMQEVIATMVKRFKQEAASLGLNYDVHRVVTMASIVEKETAVPDERPLVASVYYNRLAKNIALAADPSVIYAKLLDGSYEGALHRGDTQINSPYNTYRYRGLPPGPIANPGRSALAAAMHPATSDYFFFVSDGNGHHRFARSFEEHNRNVAVLRKVVRSR